jgi:hypothetical protein
MSEHSTAFSASQNETVDIIEVIRKLRNDLIKDFLDERNLVVYLSEQYRVLELSALKVEFIKKDLKNLLITPVDKEWYKSIIDDFETSGSAALADKNEKLFYKEIEGVLKKYIY